MPRERFDDPTTPGRYAQVNWRRHGDSDPDAPGYVQVSTHDQTEDHPAGELIGWAIGIISNVDAPTPGWEQQTAEWREAARAWLDKAATHSAELDSNYAQLDEKQAAAMIRTLHKARRQAFGTPRFATGGLITSGVPVAIDPAEHLMRYVSIDDNTRWQCVRSEHEGLPCSVEGATEVPTGR